MDRIKSLKQYFDEKISGNKFWYGFTGLNDYKKVGYGIPDNVYCLHEEDFLYNQDENKIIFNIGKYSEKKIDFLLKSIFIPLDEMSFDLIQEIKNNKTKLILVNKIKNQTDDFYNLVYKFFSDIDYTPEYKGEWKCQE